MEVGCVDLKKKKTGQCGARGAASGAGNSCVPPARLPAAAGERPWESHLSTGSTSLSEPELSQHIRSGGRRESRCSISPNIGHPKKPCSALKPEGRGFVLSPDKAQETPPSPPPPGSMQTSLQKADTASGLFLAREGGGVLPIQTPPRWAVSPRFIFLKEQRPLLENNKMQCV